MENQIENNFEKKKDPIKINKKVILLVISIFIIILIVCAFMYKRAKDKDDVQNNFSDNSNSEKTVVLSKKLEDDYKSGLLTLDDYVKQTAYSIFEPDKLDDSYKSLDNSEGGVEPAQLFQRLSDLEGLSDETIAYVACKYMLCDVELDGGAENEDVSNDKQDYRIENLASKDTDLTRLDNVILSSNNNFLIYYTKEGNNAITDEKANYIANLLESQIFKYKSVLGLDYKYEGNFDFFSKVLPLHTIKTNAQSLLRKHGIDTEYLTTAMPVYIINLEGTGRLGFYLPPIDVKTDVALKIYDIFADLGLTIETVNSTYSFPYFVISSTIDEGLDTQIVSAHELFHHYQKYICGNGSYVSCSSGLFTEETLADYAVSATLNTKKEDTVLNLHSYWSVLEATEPIDRLGEKTYGADTVGYAAFVFANNYARIVENGNNILFNSMKEVNALKYLKDNSGDKYRSVLIDTAVKNLTNNYDNGLYIATKNGKRFYPSAYASIAKDDDKSVDINYSSFHYYYLNTSTYKDTKVTFSGDTDDLSIVVIAKKNNQYEYRQQQSLDKDVVIDVNKYSDYDTVAIAIVNSQISKSLSYSYRSEEIDDTNEDDLCENGCSEEEKLKNKYSFNYSLYIDGVNIKLPMKVTEFLSLGFTPMYENKNKILESRAKANTTYGTYNSNATLNVAGLFTNGKTSNIELLVRNSSNEAKPFVDCEIIGIGIINTFDTKYYLTIGEVKIVNNKTKKVAIIDKSSYEEIKEGFGIHNTYDSKNELNYIPDMNLDGIIDSDDYFQGGKNNLHFNFNSETQILDSYNFHIYYEGITE